MRALVCVSGSEETKLQGRFGRERHVVHITASQGTPVTVNSQRFGGIFHVFCTSWNTKTRELTFRDGAGKGAAACASARASSRWALCFTARFLS